MGFCGCSLRASSICAAVFGIIESIIGFIIATICLIVKGYGVLYGEKTTSGVLFRLIVIPELLGVMVTFLFFNVFWLLASILLIVGIVKKNARFHKVWVTVSTLVFMSDVISDIFLVVGFVKADNFWPELTDAYIYKNGVRSFHDTYTSAFTALIVLGTRAFVGLIINIFLIIYTYDRAIEIERGQPANAFIYGGQPQQTLQAPGQSAGAVPFVVYPVREVQNQTYRTGIPVVIQGGQQQHGLLVPEQPADTAPLINYSILPNPTYNPGIPVVEKVGSQPDQQY